MKHNLRSSNGQFISRKPATVVAGRLYGYKGTVVRAGALTPTGKRYVCIHKSLDGLVDDSELYRVDRKTVDQYLANR